MFEVVVWDLRDCESAEPSSLLGFFETLADAQLEIRECLDGIHGPFILRWEIRNGDKIVDRG